jgi:hypothetical protein
MMKRLQTQKGESSSLSEGLSGFIQGEMEIRAFQSLSQQNTKPDRAKKNPGRKSVGFDWASFRPLAFRGVLISLVAIAAFWFPALTLSQASVDREMVIPQHDELTHRTLDNGVEIYQLSSPAYRFSDVHWIGNEPIVWIEVEGLDGTATVGDVGILGVDVRDHRSMTLAMPKGQEGMPGSDPVYEASVRSASVLPLDFEHPLTNRFLVAGTEERSGDVVVMSRPWNRAFADPTVLLRTSRDSWVWGEQNDLLHPRIGESLMNPNGTTICYLLADATLGHTYLVEQSLGSDTWLDLSEPRTSPGSEIVAGSVQFSPDGKHILYLRQRSIGGSELWRVSSSGTEQDGQLIAKGVMGNSYSINPTGDTVLLTLIGDSTEGIEDQLALVQIHTKYVKRLGLGQVSPDAFHPSGDYFVINQAPAGNPQSARQLVAVRTNDVNKRVPITNFERGVTSAYAVSPDGRYISGIAGDVSTPSMLVMTWATLNLNSL